MTGFVRIIRVQDRDESPVLIAVDQIVRVTVEDRYHPNEKAIIFLKDGTKVTTNWRHNVESIQAAIEQQGDLP